MRSAGRPRLALRQFRADPWVSLLLAAVVVIVTMVATLGPRLVLDINTRQVEHVINGLSSTQRDITATSAQSVLTARVGDTIEQTVEANWAESMQRMEEIKERQPEPLHSMMGTGEFFAEVGDATQMLGCHPMDASCTDHLPDGSPFVMMTMPVRIDPYLEQHVEIVEGEWPEPVVNYGSSRDGDDGEVVTVDPEPIEVVLLDEAASEIGWEVGESISGYLLVGTYRPTDPDDPRWDQASNSISMNTTNDPNQGNLAHTSAYLAPGTSGHIHPVNSNLRLRYYYPVDASHVRADQIDQVVAQLTNLATIAEPVLSERQVNEAVSLPEVRVNFASEAVENFRELSSQQNATNAILLVVAAGPIGVTLTVFGLGARLIVTRRQSALALASARGGSRGQLRGLLALEGLVLGVPAAIAGYFLAGLLLPVRTGTVEWVVTGLAAVVPAVALWLSPAAPSLRETRRDLAGRSTSKVRWVVEVAVFALAALATWQLLSRGLTTDNAGGPDLLMSATPVLICLAACVLTLRVYPIPGHLLTQVLRRRRGLTAFLGASRSVRDATGGVMPALALVLGVAVAVSSVVMASTIIRGTEASAWSENGADVRFSGPFMTEELVEQIGELSGVDAVATVTPARGGAALTGEIASPNATVLIADESIREVYAATGELEPLPDAFFEQRTPVPVLTGGRITPGSGSAQLGGVGEVEVLDHLSGGLPGVRAPREFVVISRANWEATGGSVPVGSLALIALADGGEPDQVADDLRGLANGLVETAETKAADFLATPVNSGLNQVFTIAAVVTLTLTVLSVLLVQLMGSPARARLLAVLRTIGLARRQGRGLVAWEMAPLVVAAVLTGIVAGIAIPWLLLRAVDLRGLTGGVLQPPLYVDVPLLGATLLALMVVVGATVTVSSITANRTNVAQQLRIGEER